MMLSFRNFGCAWLLLAASVLAIAQELPESVAPATDTATSSASVPEARPVPNTTSSTNATESQPLDQIVLQQPGFRVEDLPRLLRLLEVDYKDGVLSVVSQNATLGDLLEEIGARIGTEIEVAPELAGQMMNVELGPASSRDVLMKLLDSPNIDYVILGSAVQPAAMQRILVKLRADGAPIIASGQQPDNSSDNNNEEKEVTIDEANRAVEPPPPGIVAEEQSLPPQAFTPVGTDPAEARRLKNLQEIQRIDEQARRKKASQSVPQSDPNNPPSQD
jgi:hypothetical protein